MKFRLALVLPTYLVMYSLIFFTAFLLRFDFELADSVTKLFWDCLPVVLTIKLATYLAIGEWRRSFRYVTLSDVLYVVASATAAAIILYSINLLVLVPRIPRSVVLIDWALTIPMAGLLRGGIRAYAELLRPIFTKDNRHRALIYGADRNAIAILRTIQAADTGYQVVGLIDDNGKNLGALVAGIHVYSISKGWSWLSRTLDTTQVLIPSTVPGTKVRKILRNCFKAGLKAHVIPAVHELAGGRYKLTVRDVGISDLLRREPAQLDIESIKDCVARKRILVTGAAGSIGSELCRQLLELNPASLVLVDQSEFGIFSIENEFRERLNTGCSLHFIIADITDLQATARIMAEHRPQLVFHAAAYKHVPLMESNPHEAIRNNVFGTKCIVDLSDRFGVERFTLISSDKAVRPTNIMGSTKLVSEKYVQAASSRSKTQFVTVRFGNVLDSAGSVVPTFRDQINAGGPITVTHPDVERFFMTIPEAAGLVIQAGAIGSSGDVLILEMGELVKIVELAKDMIYLSGLNFPDDIDILFTGLRPGEKLYEELFYDAEAGTKKVHDKIFSVSGQVPSLIEANQNLILLAGSLEKSAVEAKQILNRIVAAYVDADQPPTSLKSAA